ncbi:MAG: primosomal protein N' [Alphaproteobacteria bacterium]|nr:primosomal protein N' [Alphaproteobacteria bacterium]
MLVDVALPLSTGPYTYESGSIALARGDVVKVPLRNKKEIGVVLGSAKNKLGCAPEKIKKVEAKYEFVRITEKHFEFLEKFTAYNMCEFWQTLKMSIGIDDAFEDVDVRRAKKAEPQIISYSPCELATEQRAAAETLAAKLNEGFSATLLDGITGSGKTEVYFSAAAKALAGTNAQILILLPEIALTAQFLSKFEKRFGTKPIVWHSGITKADRRNAYQQISDGDARLVLGTRSALMLPYKNLKFIILDEEHDGSYKQEDQAIYNARDMAVLRAKIEDIPIVLASATPSLETIKNVCDGKYGIVKLHERFGGATLPQIELIDLKNDRPLKGDFISATLTKKIRDTLNDKQQVMLFLNRRGYAPIVLCRGCGHKLACPNCSINLTAHDVANLSAKCHYCGHSSRLPAVCKQCASPADWLLFGPGVERVRDEIAHKFPTARVAVISSDEITSTSKLDKIISQIENREIDIIVGTQIVIKGHHFPNLTLVGVVDGDMGFSVSDLRANESAFQTITQVAGRSGRGDVPGIVLIQTYNPDNKVLDAIINNDRDRFVNAELTERKAALMPPFTKLASILLTSGDRIALEEYARDLARTMPLNIAGLRVFGPIDAPLAMIKKQHRKRFLLIADKTAKLQPIIKKWLEITPPPAKVKTKIDIDPYNFL